MNSPDGTSGFNTASLLIARLAKACYDALADPSKTVGLAQPATV